MKKKFVIDSFALLRFFQQEPGWEKVDKILHSHSSENSKVLLCLINWGELFYIVRRRFGKEKAIEALNLIEQLPVEISDIDRELTLHAAEIKSIIPISYADTFCIATALKYGAKILTGDPEFKQIEKMAEVEWL